MRIWTSLTVCCCWCWQSHKMTKRLKWAFPQFDYSPKAGPSEWSLELLSFSYTLLQSAYLCTLGHSFELCTLGHSSELKTIHCHIVIELLRLLSILGSPLVCRCFLCIPGFHTWDGRQPVMVEMVNELCGFELHVYLGVEYSQVGTLGM